MSRTCPTVTIEIDNVKYEVEKGKNLLDACLSLNLNVPYFCWHPSLGSVGSCRQCAVRVYSDEDDTQGSILMSCMTPVADGMRLSVNEETVSKFRDTCIEVTMASHPHDCPVCEEGGECHLQDVTHMSNHTQRRYQGKKKTHENQDLGPCINHEMNRCITCYRCVRFYNDYAGGKDLAALGLRENTYFGRHEDGTLESVFSGNLVEVCPTGVFTDKTLARSYNRKWDLQTAPSVCHGCSLGCNISPGERQGEIKRIVNRYHGEVNGYFICDKGRFAYDHINAEARLRLCSQKIDGKEQIIDYQQTIRAASAALLEAGLLEPSSGKCIAFGSEKSSVEENFLLKQLVGAKNFCSGMPGERQAMLTDILRIYQDQRINIVSLKESEDCDAVLILGEDLINSAPRMALSIRQATRNLSFAQAEAIEIPRWQDISVRTLAQDTRSPLIIASVAGTSLDEIASDVLRASPDDIANFGYAVAHAIDPSLRNADLSPDLGALSKKVARILSAAKKPLVISGTSLNCRELIHATSQISMALSKVHSNGSIVPCATSFVLPEANSLGLAMLLDEDSMSLEQALQKGDVDASIILQNDLFQHAEAATVDSFLQKSKTTIALSQLANRTTSAADIIFPAASFVETEGTVVNNEGRAQRFFEVFSTKEESLKDNWFTLSQLARQVLAASAAEQHELDKSQGEVKRISELNSFDDVVASVSQHSALFASWKDIAPDANFRIAGMKVPRQPHRYSGRTSLEADINVSEKKQPQDSDSALSFSMEGAPVDSPSSLNALIWSPGWNSNEAINKFQDEIGGQLHGGNPGLRLLEEKKDTLSRFSPLYPKPKNPHMILAVSQARLFDSCELSVMSSALALRADSRVAMVNSSTAADFNLADGESITIAVKGSQVTLKLSIDAKIPAGIVIVPDDIETRQFLPAALLPSASHIAGGSNE